MENWGSWAAVYPRTWADSVWTSKAPCSSLKAWGEATALPSASQRTQASRPCPSFTTGMKPKSRNTSQDWPLALNSNLQEDILFKAHLDKAYYKKLFYPFSVLAILIFFGSFIFGSLRDSSPGSRIVLAVLGGFLYRISQDLSASIFISYNLPILIGVVIPACILVLISIYSYKKI